MEIALLTSSVSRRGGGVFTALCRWSSELARLPNLRLCVLGLADEYTQADLHCWNGVPLRFFPVAGPRSFGFARGLLPAIRSLSPDLLHLHGLWMYPSVVAARWARQVRRPCVVSPHGMLDPWALGNSRWKKRLAAWLYENRNLHGAACIHCLCASEATSVRAYGLKNPICVIPNGVDLPAKWPSNAPAWTRELPAGSSVLLYLGRLHPKKGLPNLVRAWASLSAAERKDWVLVIAGWDQGGHQEELQRLARELGVDSSVYFPGPQFGEDKEASLARAQAFVLPSFSEGLPVAILEAWAYGLPVLMTPQCNLPEGFAAGAAVAIDPEPASIATGLRELFGMSGAERRQMGERGRRLVQDKFSWPKIARQMMQVYTWVLGQGPKPDGVLTA